MMNTSRRIIQKNHSRHHKNLERLDFFNSFSKQSVSKLREAYEQAKQNNQTGGVKDE